MTRLTRKGTRFVWNDACEKVFEELKRRLTTAPVLVMPDRGVVIQCTVMLRKRGWGAY